MNGDWTTTVIDGKPVDLFDPAVPPRSALLFLHAYDLRTLREDLVYTRLLAETGLACVCPPGGYSWWVDRPSPAFDEQFTPEAWLRERVVPFISERWGLEGRPLGLLGISMGGQAALRLAFKYPKRFPAVAALAPAIEYHELYGQGSPLDELYDSKEQCRQDTAAMHVQPGHVSPHLFFASDPDDDFWFRGCDRLREKLVALGVEHEADLATRAGGHTWRYFDHMAPRAVRFLRDGLERQALRLL
jgi:S-formylglutathione hydrolase